MGPRLSCPCCGLHRNTTILHPIPSYPVLPLSWHGLAVTVDRSPGARSTLSHLTRSKCPHAQGTAQQAPAPGVTPGSSQREAWPHPPAGASKSVSVGRRRLEH